MALSNGVEKNRNNVSHERVAIEAIEGDMLILEGLWLAAQVGVCKNGSRSSRLARHPFS